MSPWNLETLKIKDEYNTLIIKDEDITGGGGNG